MTAVPEVTVGDWLRSVPSALVALATGSTRCVPDLLGTPLVLPDGRRYVVFRHTRRDDARWARGAPAAVLHPRFRLRGFGPRRRRLHAFFRVVCIVTTPFFVGLPGFRSKLWMVDPATGDFAGLYEWDDVASAEAYARGLARVLRLLAVPGSVTYEVVAAPSAGAYLTAPFRAA